MGPNIYPRKFACHVGGQFAANIFERLDHVFVIKGMAGSRNRSEADHVELLQLLREHRTIPQGNLVKEKMEERTSFLKKRSKKLLLVFGLGTFQYPV